MPDRSEPRRQAADRFMRAIFGPGTPELGAPQADAIVDAFAELAGEPGLPRDIPLVPPYRPLEVHPGKHRWLAHDGYPRHQHSENGVLTICPHRTTLAGDCPEHCWSAPAAPVTVEVLPGDWWRPAPGEATAHTHSCRGQSLAHTHEDGQVAHSYFEHESEPVRLRAALRELVARWRSEAALEEYGPAQARHLRRHIAQLEEVLRQDG